MRILRNISPGEEVFIKTCPGLHLCLEQVGHTAEYRIPRKRRWSRTTPRMDAFYGIVLSNQDFVLRVRPTQLVGSQRQSREVGTQIAEVPYNALLKVLVFTGQTNEATVKEGRKLVGGSTFSSWRSIGWDNRKYTEIPLENPHAKPAERLFEEVRIA